MGFISQQTAKMAEYCVKDVASQTTCPYPKISMWNASRVQVELLISPLDSVTVTTNCP